MALIDYDNKSAGVVEPFLEAIAEVVRLDRYTEHDPKFWSHAICPDCFKKIRAEMGARRLNLARPEQQD